MEYVIDYAPQLAFVVGVVFFWLAFKAGRSYFPTKK